MIGNIPNRFGVLRNPARFLALLVCAMLCLLISPAGINTSFAQELVPVTSRKTVGWGKSAGELPAPINPQEEEIDLSILDEQIGELPRYTGGPSRASELITQRYPDGKPQITRRVMQDEQGNFLNHGAWKLFNQRGQTMAEGTFKEGYMHGSWQRWHPGNSPGLFSEAPFNLFKGPWLSVANFNKGKLDGVWTIYDRNRRKIFELPFKKGVRDGRAVWYLPNNRPMREVDFRKGLVHGQMIEFDREGKKTRDVTFDEGQELITRTEFYFKDQKKAESNFLGPKTSFITDDDWWNAEPAQIEIQGSELQHGPTREWYPNGQMRLAGQYKQGKQVGSFRWWHANGQKQIEGHFKEGIKHGIWTWHHANSTKAIEGEYENDRETGVWRWWDENGELEDERNFSLESLDTQDLEGIESMEEADSSATPDESNEAEQPSDFNIEEIPPQSESPDRDT